MQLPFPFIPRLQKLAIYSSLQVHSPLIPDRARVRPKMADRAVELGLELVDKLVDALRVKAVRAAITVIRTTRSDQQAVRPRAPPRPEEMSLNSYALLRAYVLMAVTGLGFLALTWSTVVLLGGFVTSLGKKDFWCLTSISMIQAARIFNDSGDNLFPIFVNLREKLMSKISANPLLFLMQKSRRHPMRLSQVFTVVWIQLVLFVLQIVSIPVLAVVLIAGLLYAYGPVACVVLSVWRLRQHDYGNTAGDDSKANLVPALTIFYSLVISQGVLYFLWHLIDGAATLVVISFCEDCKLPQKWGSITVVDYLIDTRAKCWRDPTSIDGRSLINYAIDLVNSETQKDYLSGVRLLDNFIKLKADVRSLLLPSRPKIQKLIDTLGWRSSDRELREVVARIVAYLAGDIHLSQFPGATWCISSLLDTTMPCWNNQGPSHHSPVGESKKDANGAKERLISVVKGIEQYEAESVRNQGGVDSEKDDWSGLILQGLAILERLAFDQHNCSDICSTPDLLLNITAPLYYKTLIQDINVSALAGVANGSLKVVYRLIRAPKWTGKSGLVRKISSSNQALSNLNSFLDKRNKAGKELRMRAIEILTELVFDSSANLSMETKQNLIKKLLQIFLTDDEGEEEKLTVTAGKALALLSNIKTVCIFIMMEHDNVVDRLNEILNAKNNITYKTGALLIFENLFTHCTLDKDYVKEALLPKVLKEVLANSKRDHPKEQSEKKYTPLDRYFPKFVAQANTIKAIFANIKHEESQAISGPGDDEENQAISGHGDDEKRQCSGQIKSPDQEHEEKNAEMEYLESLLSLTFVICDKLITADDFNDVVQKSSIGEVKFVAKLQAIIEDNCEARADCVRIVKLCGQIALLMLQRRQVTARLKLCVDSLEKASEILSDLESCMVFAGTDCGVKKTARPLLSDLVEKARKLLGY
ncbi:uncharacterized protein LOC119349578 [Triticum dicoccoides]|uniref:uncharacterized protein LOC119349578 n=1 Tax=Triticum dicoccoides TaxID=85692 RepID=UPI001890B1BC|nr:uncharacterized protein LOC119349578 [Triticum dicoccoides]